MKTIDFDYQVPKGLIAQYPMENRDECRLMSLDRTTQSISHAWFTDLHRILRPGDRLVFNDTKVVPARLWCVKETGGGVELLFTRKIDRRSCEVSWSSPQKRYDSTRSFGLPTIPPYG